MLYKIQYIDQSDRQTVLDANTDKILIEEQNIAEGNFLIYSDTPSLEVQIAQLKEDNLIIREDSLILMDVLATMFEVMLEKGTV